MSARSSEISAEIPGSDDDHKRRSIQKSKITEMDQRLGSRREEKNQQEQEPEDIPEGGIEM